MAFEDENPIDKAEANPIWQTLEEGRRRTQVSRMAANAVSRVRSPFNVFFLEFKFQVTTPGIQRHFLQCDTKQEVPRFVTLQTTTSRPLEEIHNLVLTGPRILTYEAEILRSSIRYGPIDMGRNIDEDLCELSPAVSLPMQQHPKCSANPFVLERAHLRLE